MSLVGKSIPRKEGRKKVTGQALYVDDLSFPGMLHGVTVRSSIPRGRIKSISFDQPPVSSTPLGMPSRGPLPAGGSDRKIPWDEFTIVTAKDIRDLKLGENYVALILNDQPYLADDVVNHPEEAIVLLAHPDKYLLEEARRHVSIEYEELPAIFSLQDSLAKKEIIWGDDNVFKKFLVDKGNVDDAWSKAYFIVAGEYETGAQEQLYIENNGAIAIANPSEGVTVWGSMQCPYYVHKALIKLFGLPEEKIRVIQTETGGGFGGKEEYPSMIAGHAALLAWKSGLPVKMIYYGRDDEAPSFAHEPQDGSHKRRKAFGDGNRFRDRWRRVLYAFAGRVIARDDSRRRPLLLSKRSHQKHGRRDEHAAARRFQRVWGAAEHLCAGAPSGQSCKDCRVNSRRISPPQLYS